jgi:hypothetical protein
MPAEEKLRAERVLGARACSLAHPLIAAAARDGIGTIARPSRIAGGRATRRRGRGGSARCRHLMRAAPRGDDAVVSRLHRADEAARRPGGLTAGNCSNALRSCCAARVRCRSSPARGRRRACRAALRRGPQRQHRGGPGACRRIARDAPRRRQRACARPTTVPARLPPCSRRWIRMRSQPCPSPVARPSLDDVCRRVAGRWFPTAEGLTTRQGAPMTANRRHLGAGRPCAAVSRMSPAMVSRRHARPAGDPGCCSSSRCLRRRCPDFAGGDHQQYLVPGLIVMTAFFSSGWNGMRRSKISIVASPIAGSSPVRRLSLIAGEVPTSYRSRSSRRSSLPCAIGMAFPGGRDGRARTRAHRGAARHRVQRTGARHSQGPDGDRSGRAPAAAGEHRDVPQGDAGERVLATTFGHDERGLRALCGTLVRVNVALERSSVPPGC